MSWVGWLDLVGVAGLVAALTSLLFVKARRVGFAALGFLSVALGCYLFVSASNAAEHLAGVTWLDVPEDYAELLFFPFMLFFVYSAWLRVEIAVREDAERRLRRFGEALRSVKRLNQVIVREEDRDHLIRKAVRTLVAQGYLRGAWVALLDAEGHVTQSSKAGEQDVVGKLLEMCRELQFPACIERALSTAEVTPVAPGADLCRGCVLRESHIERPLLIVRLEHSGRLYGILAGHVAGDVDIRPEEWALFLEVAHDLSLALSKFEVQAERETLQTQLREAQKMEAVGRLASGIAHDFRNELTVIGGYSDLALSELHEESPLRSRLTAISDATRRAARLASELLMFARREILNPTSVDLNQAIVEARAVIRSMAGGNVLLRLELAEDLEMVEVDIQQLQHAVLNLVVNARDAMPRGGRLTLTTANVALDAEAAAAIPGVREGRWVRLTVADTGGGMDTATLERVFEPFFTTKARGKGTGLGLSMVYGFVRQSGGAIRGWSRPGEGTRFELYFPSVGAAPAQARAEPDEAAAEAHPCGTETVLLVEDEVAVRELVQDVLEECGYKVLQAPDGPTALDVARRYTGAIDLVLSDVIMPGMSGPEMVETLLAERPGIRVVFMSGYAGETLESQQMIPEGQTLLTKPFLPAEVARAVRHGLDG